MAKVVVFRGVCCSDPTGFLLKSFNKSGNLRLSRGSASVLGTGTLQTPLSSSRLEIGCKSPSSGLPQELSRRSSGSSENREFSRDRFEKSANKFVVSEGGVEESVNHEESGKSGSCSVRSVGKELEVSISLNMSASSAR